MSQETDSAEVMMDGGEPGCVDLLRRVFLEELGLDKSVLQWWMMVEVAVLERRWNFFRALHSNSQRSDESRMTLIENAAASWKRRKRIERCLNDIQSNDMIQMEGIESMIDLKIGQLYLLLNVGWLTCVVNEHSEDMQRNSQQRWIPDNTKQDCITDMSCSKIASKSIKTKRCRIEEGWMDDEELTGLFSSDDGGSEEGYSGDHSTRTDDSSRHSSIVPSVFIANGKNDEMTVMVDSNEESTLTASEDDCQTNSQYSKHNEINNKLSPMRKHSDVLIDYLPEFIQRLERLFGFNDKLTLDWFEPLTLYALHRNVNTIHGMSQMLIYSQSEQKDTVERLRILLFQLISQVKLQSILRCNHRSRLSHPLSDFLMTTIEDLPMSMRDPLLTAIEQDQQQQQQQSNNDMNNANDSEDTNECRWQNVERLANESSFGTDIYSFERFVSLMDRFFFDELIPLSHIDDHTSLFDYHSLARWGAFETSIESFNQPFSQNQSVKSDATTKEIRISTGKRSTSAQSAWTIPSAVSESASPLHTLAEPSIRSRKRCLSSSMNEFVQTETQVPSMNKRRKSNKEGKTGQSDVSSYMSACIIQ